MAETEKKQAATAKKEAAEPAVTETAAEGEAVKPAKKPAAKKSVKAVADAVKAAADAVKAAADAVKAAADAEAETEVKPAKKTTAKKAAAPAAEKPAKKPAAKKAPAAAADGAEAKPAKKAAAKKVAEPVKEEAPAKKYSQDGRYRLYARYHEEVVPALMSERPYKNVMEVPKLDKVVVNMRLGDVKDNAKSVQTAIAELGQITGQKPVVCKAKKSVANFKVREGMTIGAKVTLRGLRAYEFFDKLVSIALPRVRDFRGVSGKSFDGRGNYALGVKEQIIFPEISYELVEKLRGFDVAVITTAKTDDEAKALLTKLGMPFKN